MPSASKLCIIRDLYRTNATATNYPNLTNWSKTTYVSKFTVRIFLAKTDLIGMIF